MLRSMFGWGIELSSSWHCFFPIPHPTLAYVTYQDLRAISSFQEQTVIAVKAPPETQLEVPDLSEVCMGSGNGAGAWVLPSCPDPAALWGGPVGAAVSP